MKGIDTAVLLRLLRGDPKVRKLLLSLEGEELATTEWNLLELEALARSDASAGRERRRAALEKLRRRLTVIPIDERAVRHTASLHGSIRGAPQMIEAAILGALESRGCTTLYSGRALASGGVRTRVKLEVV